MYQLCYRFVGNHEDASDLSQDVFLRAYRGLGNFRGGSSLATWLYRIGVNVCLNRVGAKTLADAKPIDERQHIDTRSESAVAIACCGTSARARARGRSRSCRRKQRATLILRMYHELSHEEIADVLGSSVGAVKANFFHALGNLKKQLGRRRARHMAHLTAAEFVDLAEGDAAPNVGAAPRRCDRCRRQLAESARDDGRRAAAAMCPSRRRCSGIICRRACARRGRGSAPPRSARVALVGGWWLPARGGVAVSVVVAASVAACARTPTPAAPAPVVAQAPSDPQLLRDRRTIRRSTWWPTSAGR